MEATWIITTVILITTAGGQHREEMEGAGGPREVSLCLRDRKELIEALRTKFTLIGHRPGEIPVKLISLR